MAVSLIVTEQNSPNKDYESIFYENRYNERMKLPLFQKIDIQDINEDSLKSIFKKNTVGQLPTILILDKDLVQFAEHFAQTCAMILEEMNINPFFPYPTYVLSQEKIHFKGMPQLRNTAEAPKHFVKKIKKVKNREQTLLSKADTFRSRIDNQSVTDDYEYLLKRRMLNHKLRDLVREKSFYQDLLKTIPEE